MCVSVFGSTAITAQGIEFIHDKKFQELLNMAKAQNKLLFMDCFTSWCGPCKRLAAYTFPDSAVGRFFNATFINTSFDMEKDEGVDIANRFGIRSYPSLLWLDGDGNVKYKVVGAMDGPTLIDHGKKAIDPTPEILAKMRKEYSDGVRDVNFMSDYVNTLYNAGEEYLDFFNEYLRLLKPADFKDAKHAKTIFNLTNDIKSPGLPYLEKSRDYYQNLVGAEAYNKKINQIATAAVESAVMKGDQAVLIAALDIIKANKAPDAQQQSLKLAMDFYSGTGDWINYDKNATVYIKKYGGKDAKLLNDVAWDYFLNLHDASQLEKATKWAYEAINIDNKYTYNLTYAYLLYKQNNLKEAEKACDYAIIRARNENVTPTSADALKEAIKKSAYGQ
jgi:thiol-disulfide isomerase/thioredoxin